MSESPDARQYAPATLRNREPILDVLWQFLPPTGTILEISSGTGEHAVFFAPRLYPRQWIPSDPNPLARESIAAWRECHPAENLHSAIAIDVRDSIWAVEKAQLPESLSGLDLIENPIRAIVNINMIHISPFSACLGLMAGAKRILPKGGILYLYGPFKINGKHTAPSNEAFDRSLRMQNPEWGVRNLDEVVEVAGDRNLSFVKTVNMPANNLSVIFQA
ncbi:MAG TPA: SAM-dependent methyltransferase [Cyanobacteria bacterium UBA11149]|nr:SAM-dependent methyltransferase [Cyanobacteria bacterium UBA11367]HBE57894.1 SAM-dependent methyltransferase [Cyanobacteria bacterium UBA11366]HBK65645.1 SAM-dependent methyltransferase [Cyanobacteria bacterium UBA11166]HBR74852.1 SAM-dependent methyltransferase [Cyanobacteria bacterium UBA11159]HBS69066.1 SAM-dependent methyltransferase [Cyanobacteria bacterium UBA11153]HBW90959.1 SAM-dependent methyltransferase [Cyanobacteria bacterium UBA11149]